MTDDKPKTPGMAEVSVEFEHEVIDQDAMLEKLADEMYAADEAYDAAWQMLDEAESAARKADPEAVFPASFSLSVPTISHLFEETGTLTPSPEQIRKFTRGNPGNPKAQAETLIKHLVKYGERCVAAFEAQGWAEKHAEVARTKAQEETTFTQVLETPAQGLRGIRAKAKAMLLPHEWEAAKRGDASNLDGQVNAAALVPLVADLERLAGTILPEDPVLALKRQWDDRDQRLRDEPDDSDAVRDPLYKARTDVEYAIYRTPATTLRGIVLKLWLWTRTATPELGSKVDWWKDPIVDMHGFDYMPVASALQDLERMSGGAATRTVAPAAATETGVTRLAALWGEYVGALDALCDATEAEEAGRGIFNTANIVTEPEQEALATKESAAKVHENEAWDAFLEAPCGTMAEVLFKLHTVHEQLKEHAFASRTEDLFNAAMRDYERMMGEGAAMTNQPSETVAALASRLPALHTNMDEAERTPRQQGTEQAVENVEMQIVRAMGQSLQDALAQTVQVYGYVCQAADNVEDNYTEQQLFKVERLLFSIRTVLEREAGVDAALFGAETYMPKDYNPHNPGCKRSRIT